MNDIYAYTFRGVGRLQINLVVDLYGDTQHMYENPSHMKLLFNFAIIYNHSKYQPGRKPSELKLN